LFHHFRRFLEAAWKKGIDVAPLKGAHLLTSVYPEGEDRGMLADVDFLVRPADWETALDLLVDLGFVRRQNPRRPITFEEFHEAGFTLSLGENSKILFEPHRRLIQTARHPIDYDALWRRSYESTFDGAPCRRLSASDHFLHAAVHMTTNFFARPGRGLRDMELLIEKGGADLEEIAARAFEWECVRSTWFALALLNEVAPHLGAGAFLKKLEPPAHIRAAARLLTPDARGFRRDDLPLRVKEAVFFPLLLDGPRPLLRFCRYYFWLRARDAASALASRITS
jgi:hypothetical protein